ncbi:uncharacterized protein LOC143591926 [Bidens hawaiensis]|uniref:uncharacterized protein LOC143591926 n=1 Tax=Bidens hawaiensis TaxID=980011 RepID=UPI004049ED9B
MDTDPPPPSSRKKFSKSTKNKLKFTPKPPSQRRRTLVLPKSDSSETDSETDRELIRAAIARLRSGGSKVEKKSSDNVTPSQEAGSSKTLDPPKKDKNAKNNSNLKDGAGSSGKMVTFSSSSVTKDEYNDYMLVDDESGSSSNNSETEYKEPWNPRTYYPISIPLRPLGSRDPEVLNVEEFVKQDVYDETKVNSALELGLSGLDDGDENQMILFKFPNQLPVDQVPVSTKGKEKVGSSSSLQEDGSNKRAGLKDLPNGHIGKMLVYKSGAIKWKLGDTIFDVSAGTPFRSDRSVAMMNTESKDCCVLGNVNKRAMVAPDLNSIVDIIN